MQQPVLRNNGIRDIPLEPIGTDHGGQPIYVIAQRLQGKAQAWHRRKGCPRWLFRLVKANWRCVRWVVMVRV